MNPIAPLYYTPQEAALVLGVPVRTIYSMIASGRLAVKRIGKTGRTYRIPRRDVDPPETMRFRKGT
ncbi:MAG: helix-turn-helix domain-containing protein [Acidobacteria bacterium]|nr:helix-turn-helix domain-containing protein [Acidobacteriota bacterium]